MKFPHALTCTCKLGIALLAGVFVAPAALAQAPADQPQAPADQPRSEADQLLRHSQELKHQGRHEEARQAMRESEELAARGDPTDRERPAREAERAELNQLREDLMRKLEDLRAAGRDDQAIEVKQRILKIERELQRPAEHRETTRPPSPEATAELHRRLHHLRVAIDNLHAAGMHDVAKQLAEEATGLERKLHQDPPRPEKPRPGREHPEHAGPAQHPLQAQIEELHHNLRELRAQVEELRRERRP